MSNRHNSSNEGQLSDEEQNPMNNGYIYVVIVIPIPIQHPTRLAEPATDQRIIDPQAMTNPEIDDLIQQAPEPLEATIPVAYWCAFTLFHLLVYYYPFLFLLVLVDYWMMTYNNQPTVILPEPQPRHSDVPFHHVFDLDRDAEAEHRIANPTPDFEMSPTVEIPAPYGVEDASINNNNGRINPIIRNERIIRTRTNMNEVVNFADNIQQRDPTPPTAENRLVPVQNHDQTNQPVTTQLRREAMEVENIAPPTGGNMQALFHATRPTDSTIPQPKNSPPRNDTFRDENTS